MAVPASGWKNKIGTSERSCKCGTWKDHWAKNAKKTWPEICSVKDCFNSATLGAHVIHAEVDGERIVPMCDPCNKRAEAFALKGSITVPSANKSQTCDKA